jgi:hypothetical protein
VSKSSRPSGLIVASYTYGNRLISADRGGMMSYYEVDGLGSARELTNAAGAVTDTYVLAWAKENAASITPSRMSEMAPARLLSARLKCPLGSMRLTGS